MRLVGWAEAEVVQGEQRVATVQRQVCQQLQGSSHPEDTLLTILCERETDKQPQPLAQ